MAKTRILPKPAHREANGLVVEQLKRNAEALEAVFKADVLTWWGPIQPPVDLLIRRAVEYRASQPNPRKRLAMVLQTSGGYIEVAERISDTIRRHYKHVSFIVPDHAMSAGTVLAMSGDEIWMDYFSTLGPIDPQVNKIWPDGRKGFVPALGYLEKYAELVQKSAEKKLTQVEAAFFVQNFDAAELYSYEQARGLSIALLKQWLVKYKFKNWKSTQTRKIKVTPQMRRKRAEEIGTKLNDTKRWLSHGRGVSAQVLRSELNLLIEDIDAHPNVREALDFYYGLLTNYLGTIRAAGALHTSELLMPL